MAINLKNAWDFTGLPRFAVAADHLVRWAVFGLCKAALLLSLLSISVESEVKAGESEGEKESVVESFWLHHCEGSRREARKTPSRVNHLTIVNRRWLQAANRDTYAPQADGHRLANGLLAPITC